MTLHLIKLSVGSEDVDSLTRWQAGRLKQHGEIWHGTRMRPRREAELLDGGSIYWVIRGLVQCRQALLDLEEAEDETGRSYVRLMLDPRIVRVEPRPQRPFQGWRYLRPDQAPRDLTAAAGGADDLPPALWAELRNLGLM
ncbi:DUF1489 domain-containing protein [Algihabitans albus]|uniref:DUF1489 family protein n=1 Tax=Algihabitans albus TaxID=2164067 RepID=UPI0035CFB86B